jgi:hypothetical protein
MANTLSLLVRQQLPEYVRNDYDAFVTFVEAYYEWMDRSNNAIQVAKSIPDYINLDSTLNAFIDYFVKQFLPLFPADRLTNPEFLIQHAKEFYHAKGTEKAVALLFRLLYNQSIETFYPKTSVLRASDGKWSQASSLRLHPTVWTQETANGATARFRTLDTALGVTPTVYLNGVLQSSGYLHSSDEPWITFTSTPVVNTEVKFTYAGDEIKDLFNTGEIVVRFVGLTSGATAVTESAEVIIEEGTITQLDYATSSATGAFSHGENVRGRWVYDITNAQYVDIYGTLISYLADIEITNGGLGYNVGDPVIVTGGDPTTTATAIVESIYSALISNITITDGGCGYQVGQRAYIVTGIPYQSRDGGIADNFNRANSGTLGGNWVTLTGQNTWNIVANTAGPNLSAGLLEITCGMANTFSLNTSRQWAEVTITRLPTTNIGYGGVSLRGSATSNTFWRFAAAKQTNSGLGGNAGSFIEAVESGVPNTAVRAWRSNTTWADGDVLRAEADGPNLFLYRNGVLDLYFYDTRIASGNNAGMYGYAQGVAGNIILIQDDFSCGNLTTSNGLNVFVNSVDTSGNVHPNTYLINKDTLNLWSNVTMSDPDYYFSPSLAENVNTIMSQAFSDFVLGQHETEKLGPITSVVITSSTSIYAPAPTLNIEPLVITVVGTTANGNTLAANVDINYFGILGRMNVQSGGSNYTVGDELSFVNVPGIGFGIGAAAEVIALHTANSGIKQVKFQPSRINGNVTVNTAVSNVEVVGVGTSFTTELLANAHIEINNESSYVSTVINATHLTVNTAFTKSSFSRKLGVYGRYFVGGMNYRQNSMPTITVSSANPEATGANIVAELIIQSGQHMSLSAQTQEPPGKIRTIKILNHGAGYRSAPVIDLSGSGNGKANAVAVMVSNLFATPGRFTTTDGFLSADKRLQSAGYYMDYVYVIRSQTELSRYGSIFKNLVHPAGMKLWGEYMIDTSVAAPQLSAANVANTYQGTA